MGGGRYFQTVWRILPDIVLILHNMHIHLPNTNDRAVLRSGKASDLCLGSCHCFLSSVKKIRAFDLK